MIRSTGTLELIFFLAVPGNDQLTGGDDNDRLLVAGTDVLLGGNGNDYFDGVSVKILCIGGDGDDTYIVVNSSDS